ncbi:MAG: UTP--glucose-1-phosphate uridylyltransferase [Acidobacteria bacterium]|nr:MAG: UTP--glucose-1-phosphate uridylyltransferase [Acidobacteriota bacterium]
MVGIVTASDPAVRNQSLDAFCRSSSVPALLAECQSLELFRKQCDNLYQRVRALFFLYAIHRFHLPGKLSHFRGPLIPFDGYAHLLKRRFEEAIRTFLETQASGGPSEGLSSALATAYHDLGFQTLADQVRRSVRSVRGNQWMFRIGHPADHPLRIRRELLPDGRVGQTSAGQDRILREQTPVRMDLSHSGWSDIFFLGMDFPEGARVLNVSIDLCVLGRDPSPLPPVEAYLRVIDEPVLKLASVDLGASATVESLGEVFDFAKDYLGLLKAALIASGIVPPGIEGAGQSLEELLSRVVAPGYGLELVSNVHSIPKGSRLAVSTSLLASLIAVCMRATGQASSLSGPLNEEERRLVAARAILGEWLAGSGGGWQDSGGLWPGIKLIQGALAEEGDPEFGISRGRLLPNHTIFRHDRVPAEVRESLQKSLVLVHGGMAQNVGPILEMVTEKYLLRSEAEWAARLQAGGILDKILECLQAGDIQALGAATTQNFYGPIQAIIPWADNLYTQTLIGRARQEFGRDFWGFWMLGGMSGGGMGFIFAPGRKAEAQERLAKLMQEAKKKLSGALPFAMDPVVYDFGINETGTCAQLLEGEQALLPQGYYVMMMPSVMRVEQQSLGRQRRRELGRLGSACRTRPEMSGLVSALFDRLLPGAVAGGSDTQHLAAFLQEYGFDATHHEQIRADLRSGRIGLAQNRLPTNSIIEDPAAEDVLDATAPLERELFQHGVASLARGEVAVVTLAAGAGSRWTQGTGVVKALHPFCKLTGRHRTFLETHLAKSRRINSKYGAELPHVITTSYLTHRPIQEYLAYEGNYRYQAPLLLSPGRSVGLRLVPTARDLRFLWEEMPQQLLDEQAQKMRASLRTALVRWALSSGEGSDYTDNTPLQCLHPVGHWYEIPNLFKNGVLQKLFALRPRLKHLMIHNIDTVGADVDPALLGAHLANASCLTFEVITRRIEDRGGGLARVGGRLRMVEGLALPREEDEFRLSYYSSNTSWVDVDQLLLAFGLTRSDLADEARVADAIRTVSARMPTYVTLKDVKKRWGYGQEDVYPVTQFEKLWGDMTAMPELKCAFLLVPRFRGQQLKDQAQLDGWLRDGSAEFVESISEFDPD